MYERGGTWKWWYVTTLICRTSRCWRYGDPPLTPDRLNAGFGFLLRDSPWHRPKCDWKCWTASMKLHFSFVFRFSPQFHYYSVLSYIVVISFSFLCEFFREFSSENLCTYSMYINPSVEDYDKWEYRLAPNGIAWNFYVLGKITLLEKKKRHYFVSR